MKNSSKFFENKDCEYYPCHEGMEHLNCMFCYCPMYRCEKCIGKPEYLEFNGKKIKDCSGCTVPHRPENYDKIMEFLKDN